MTTITPEGPVPKRRRVALIAHDHKKDDMIAFAQTHKAFLMQCDLLATGTTGGRLQDEVGLSVQRMLSGPWGGDLQIGAQLAEGRVDAVIFLRDPMTPQPHEPDINALVRACDVHNIPCATNLATADLVMVALSLAQPDPKEIHA
ncbi:methylglyoxal synthase [Ralstonia pseudosolanacearum]|uniref:methylglyoxal synthase n=1 Tax=Ralstonia pseudosolanacearum TaxID=1310165 RepID=UPI001FFC1EA8|nr:methylglyoxal synthase [Ralstonia pseudosolanacearum]